MTLLMDFGFGCYSSIRNFNFLQTDLPCILLFHLALRFLKGAAKNLEILFPSYFFCGYSIKKSVCFGLFSCRFCGAFKAWKKRNK